MSYKAKLTIIYFFSQFCFINVHSTSNRKSCNTSMAFFTRYRKPRAYFVVAVESLYTEPTKSPQTRANGRETRNAPLITNISLFVLCGTFVSGLSEWPVFKYLHTVRSILTESFNQLASGHLPNYYRALQRAGFRF